MSRGFSVRRLYYFSCLFIPSIGQIICDLSGCRRWQERQPDVYCGIVVGVVDESTVPAVEDALRDAFRVAGDRFLAPDREGEALV